MTCSIFLLICNSQTVIAIFIKPTWTPLTVYHYHVYKATDHHQYDGDNKISYQWIKCHRYLTELWMSYGCIWMIYYFIKLTNASLWHKQLQFCIYYANDLTFLHIQWVALEKCQTIHVSLFFNLFGWANVTGAVSRQVATLHSIRDRNFSLFIVFGALLWCVRAVKIKLHECVWLRTIKSLWSLSLQTTSQKWKHCLHCHQRCE